MWESLICTSDFLGGLFRSCSVLGSGFLCLTGRLRSRLLLPKRIGKESPSSLNRENLVWARSTFGHIKWQLKCLTLEIFLKAPPYLGLKISSSGFCSETVVSRRPCWKQLSRVRTDHLMSKIYWAPASGLVCVCAMNDYFLWEKTGPDLVDWLS